MTGSIVQVSVSPGGIPKRPISSGMLTPLGLTGDACAHPALHGGPMQALLLMMSEVIDELKSLGYPVFYGAMGENLTTRGLDRRQLRIGQQLRAGSATIEITKIRVPCASLDIYGPAIKRELYDKQVKAGDPSSPRWGMSGFYARVLQPGAIHPDDIIVIMNMLA